MHLLFVFSPKSPRNVEVRHLPSPEMTKFYLNFGLPVAMLGCSIVTVTAVDGRGGFEIEKKKKKFCFTSGRLSL